VSELDTRCAAVAQLATQYLEGALPDAQLTSYETHLVYCNSCVAFLDDIRTIARRLRELPPDPVDAGERQALLQAVVP
jgi:anti-sigma factor RsiW